MPTPLVLPGGAASAPPRSGCCKHSADHRGPDLSAGAINAAFGAGQGFTCETLDRLADVSPAFADRTSFRSPHISNSSHSPAHGASLCAPARVDVAAYRDQVDLIVLPALGPLTVSASDFRPAASLIDRARVVMTRWLDEGSHRYPIPNGSWRCTATPLRSRLTS
jgi:hypothetical protein